MPSVRRPLTRAEFRFLNIWRSYRSLTNGSPGVLKYSYGPDPSYGGGVTYLGDAAGVMTSSGPVIYPIDDSLVRSSFEDSFVEYVDLAQVVSEIPHEAVMDGGRLAHFPIKWAEASVDRSSGNVRSRSNHQYLMSGSRIPDRIAPNGQLGAVLGQTPPVFGGLSHSWLWYDRIAAAVTGAQQPVHGQSPMAVAREVIVHELLHQWKVNPAAGAPTDGHCAEQRYQHDGHFCLMHQPVYDPNHNGEYSDGAVDLHYRKQAATIDSEYLTIRQKAEPIPVQ